MMCTFTQCLSGLLVSSLALSGCALAPPPRPPEDELALQRARTQKRKATESWQQLQAERVTATTRAKQLQAEVAVLDEPSVAAQQARGEQQFEFDSYANTIEAALVFADSCEEHPDVGMALETGAALAEGLASYVSEPERDKALKAMDRCREQLTKRWRKKLRKVVVELRREFAVEIEDLFDEANPYSRGDLTAKVAGTALNVRMRGNFEGRARHSQDQANAWCERGNGLFTKITLKNSHGTFSCRPDESPRQLSARLLEEAQVTSNWYVVGEQATPTMPEPLPPVPAEVEQRKTELLAELRELETAAAIHEERGSKIAEQEQQARASVAAVDQRDESRVNAWRATNIERAGNVQVAGGVLAGIGGAVLLGTLGAWQSKVAGVQDALPITIGISVPVLVTGILLLTGGTVHKRRVRQVR